MAITFTPGTVHIADSHTSTDTWSHPGEPAPDFVVMLFAQSDNDGDPSGVEYGGVALSKHVSVDAASPERHVAIWKLIGGVPGGTQDAQATFFTNDQSRALVVTGTSNGAVTIVDSGSGVGFGGQPALALDSVAEVARGLVVANNVSGATPTPKTTTSSFALSGEGSFGYETASSSGSRTIGWDVAGGADYAVAGILLVDGDIELTPDPIGMQLGFRSGIALAQSGPVELAPGRMRGLQLGFRAGLRLSTMAKRQVSLVGGNVETPEMTVGGDEGEVLTQHTDQPPTWEDAGSHVHSRRWVPMVWRPDPVGSPDDWQLLHADDGSVMMTWVED